MLLQVDKSTTWHLIASSDYLGLSSGWLPVEGGDEEDTFRCLPFS